MRDKLRSLDIRLTDLAKFIGVSRPTLYRYLEMYELGNHQRIPGNILDLFRYIDYGNKLTSNQVISYIISHFPERCDEINIINAYITESPYDDPKSIFLQTVVKCRTLDSVIPYLNECMRIIEKGPDKDSEIIQISKFILFKHSISTNYPVTETEIETTKLLLRVENNG